MRHLIQTLLIATALGLILAPAFHLAHAQDAGAVVADAGAAESAGDFGAATSPGFVDWVIDLFRAAREAAGLGWLVLVGLIAGRVVRRFRGVAADRVDWFQTELGGYVFTGTVALALSVLDALAAGASISGGLLWAAVLAAVTSIASTPGEDAKVQARAGA